MCLLPQIDGRWRKLASFLFLGRRYGILLEFEESVVWDVVQIIIQEHIVLHLCNALVPLTSPCLEAESSARRVSLRVSVNGLSAGLSIGIRVD